MQRVDYFICICINYSSSAGAKLHYAIQVPHLVSDLAFGKFLRVRVCDQLATFLGRKQVTDRFELYLDNVEIARTYLRQVGNQACDLDSEMEFGVN